jgi:hypothetical protein
VSTLPGEGQSSTPFIPRPLPLADKGHLLPEFYSGATGLPVRFSEGFSLRRSQPARICEGEAEWPSYSTIPFANADQPATQTLARCNLRVQVNGQQKASNLPLA